MTKPKILIFAASNSRKSLNKLLAEHAGRVLNEAFSDAFDLNIIDLNDFETAIYSPERQNEGGIPQIIESFYGQISRSDGIIISFAEYNGSYTTAYKNIFDWCSRLDRQMYQNKLMLVMSTSPGSRGGQMVLQTAIETLPYFGGQVVSSFKLASFSDHFNTEKNVISSAKHAAEMRKCVHAFGTAILLDH